MNPDDIEKIKNSYLFNIAKDVTPITNPPQESLDIQEIIDKLEQYIKLNYPSMWVNYNEGKLYPPQDLNTLINDIIKFSNRLFKNKIEANLPENNNKQIVSKLINNQLQTILKLNNIYSDANIDYKPIILYIIGLLLPLL